MTVFIEFFSLTIQTLLNAFKRKNKMERFKHTFITNIEFGLNVYRDLCLNWSILLFRNTKVVIIVLITVWCF